MSSASMIRTVDPLSATGCSMRVAVTTMVSMRTRSASSDGESAAVVAVDPRDRKEQGGHASHRNLLTPAGCAVMTTRRPPAMTVAALSSSVVTREPSAGEHEGLSPAQEVEGAPKYPFPFADNVPVPERTTRWQVSWLAHLRFRPPSRRTLQWHSGRKLLAYSCGYSPGFAPGSLLAAHRTAPPEAIVGIAAAVSIPGGASPRQRRTPCPACQKSMPRAAWMPASKGCLTARISLTRSAYSHSAGFASLPVRITLVRGERAFRPSRTSCSDR